ncbi:MAG: hypothetical protein WC389_19660 [Lutibacter sp.]|jgi:hypothetical protein
MTAFLSGIIIGVIVGVLLGAFGSKIGNITDSVTNITGGKQVIKDSPGAIISSKIAQTEKTEKKHRLKNFINKFKINKNEKID